MSPSAMADYKEPVSAQTKHRRRWWLTPRQRPPSENFPSHLRSKPPELQPLTASFRLKSASNYFLWRTVTGQIASQRWSNCWHDRLILRNGSCHQSKSVDQLTERRLRLLIGWLDNRKVNLTKGVNIRRFTPPTIRDSTTGTFVYAASPPVSGLLAVREGGSCSGQRAPPSGHQCALYITGSDLVSSNWNLLSIICTCSSSSI